MGPGRIICMGPLNGTKITKTGIKELKGKNKIKVPLLVSNMYLYDKMSIQNSFV